MTVTAASIGPQQYTEQYDSTTESAPKSRRDVALILHAWRLPNLIDTASLIVTELVTNAIQHCPCRTTKIEVTVSRLAKEEVRIQVRDRCPTPVTPRTALPTDEGGRGLLLVETLSDRWGVDQLPAQRGKIVWADLTADP